MTRQTTPDTDSSATRIPRTKPAEVRLEELMAAAESLFLAKGVDATTVSEIVERAQVAKGTFYHYFPSKTDLLQALRDRYTERFLHRLQAAVDACPEAAWETRLRAWIHANIQAYVQTYRTHDMVYTHHHHARGNPSRNALLEQLLDLIERGNEAGAWRSASPRIAAMLIYSGVHGATDDLIAAQPADGAAFAQTVADACLRILDGTSPP
ncbi:TetR/AcrR family transcriptional regulator [Stenotrophomonas mori]|uniref:TetR/AcrR family transcriptional regulator n=1 Tax=Stenotrophomonas mori TaxID=2871096 RepID=A0ABT0SFB2_9GAMM|nr:TetR/AcrR family transcriptional regulator [Stenotrophomonas mori]MCL7714011.1 TetR/AcrR family transcriptional regulator [Stenotrophomonas mori]